MTVTAQERNKKKKFLESILRVQDGMRIVKEKRNKQRKKKSEKEKNICLSWGRNIFHEQKEIVQELL